MERKKMRLAFASDFDGTLYSWNREPHFLPADLAAIGEFRANGGLFGICTGRAPSGVYRCCGEQLKPDFLIAESGSLILDSAGRTMFEKRLSRPLVRRLVDRVNGRMPYVVHARHEVYGFGESWPGQLSVRSLDEIDGDIFHDVSASAGTETAALALCEQLKEEFGDEISVFVNVTFVDVVAGGCSKGNALRELRRLLDVDRLAGMGDSFNDLSMVEEADMGFTFPSAPEGVRSKADALADSVAEALRTFTEAMP